MDFTSGFIGMLLGILGLKFKLIMTIIKFILSSFTSYLILSMSEEMYLWGISDYNDANLVIFYNSDIFWPAIFFMVLSYLVFYWALPFFLEFILNGKLKKFIKEHYTGENDTIAKSAINIVVPFIFKLGKYTRILLPEKKMELKEDITYRAIKNQMINFICFIIHIVVCISFGLPLIFSVIGVIFGIFFLLNFLMTPFWFFHSKYFDEAIINENNKYLENPEN